MSFKVIVDEHEMYRNGRISVVPISLNQIDDFDAIVISVGDFTRTIKPSSSTNCWLVPHLFTAGTHSVRVEGHSNGELIETQSFDLDLHSPLTGSSELVKNSLLESGSNPILEGSLDSQQFPPTSFVPWFERPDCFTILKESMELGGIQDSNAEKLGEFLENGYIVLPEAINEELLNRSREALIDIEQTGFDGYVAGSSQRIEHAHEHYPALFELTRVEAVIGFLGDLFQGPSRLCQTLTYINGSEQSAHQDSIHLTPFPSGLMCGVWFALEDVQLGSGELRYWPGSHRWERLTMSGTRTNKVVAGDWTEFSTNVVSLWSEMCELSPSKPESFLAKAGSVLIWHENLMHEGLPRSDRSVSRNSMVAHYFAHGSLGYYDSSGTPAILH